MDRFGLAHFIGLHVIIDLEHPTWRWHHYLYLSLALSHFATRFLVILNTLVSFSCLFDFSLDNVDMIASLAR